jgi:hypothetical protein
MSTVEYISMQYHWNFAYGIMSAILICSLPSLTVCGNIPHIVKAVNTQDIYSNNFNVVEMKQNYFHYCTQDLNQTAEKKNAPNELIRMPSLENSNQWSSITKKTNDDLHDVKLGWDLTDLKTGGNAIFIISFLNHKTNLEEKQIEYSFKAIDPTANVTIKDAKHQKAPTGSGVQIVKLPKPGQSNLIVNITFSQQQLNNIETRNNIDSTVSNNSENISFSIMIPPKDVPSINSPNTRI